MDMGYDHRYIIYDMMHGNHLYLNSKSKEIMESWQWWSL